MMPQAPAVTAPLEDLLAGWRPGLGAGAGDPEADREALSRIADWNTVAAPAERHRVAPLLLQGIRARGAGPASGIEPRLDRVRERNVCHGPARIGALRRATGPLAAAGISCLVLKGLSFGRRPCGHPLAREAHDVDLLVSPRTFRAAERVLLENGWRRVRPSFRETPARNRWYDFSGGFDWAGQKVIGLIARPDPKAVLHEAAGAFVGPRDRERLDLPDRLFCLYFPSRPLLWPTRRKGGRKRMDPEEAKGEVPPSDPPGWRAPPASGRRGRKAEDAGRALSEVPLLALPAGGRLPPRRRGTAPAPGDP